MAPKRALQNNFETKSDGAIFEISPTSKSGGVQSPKLPCSAALHVNLSPNGILISSSVSLGLIVLSKT